MSKSTRVRRQKWESPAPAAAGNTNIHAAVTLGASAQDVNTSITNPDVPRVARIKGNAGGITGNVVITGTDILDQAVTDTIALNGSSAVDGTVAFKTITNINMPAKTNSSGDTVSVGFGAALGLDCYCDAYSFTSFAGASSYAYNKTIISKNVVTPSATLDGSTPLGLAYVPDTFPAYGRSWG